MKPRINAPDGAHLSAFRPTMTGLGERVHLAGPEIGLSTYAENIVKVLEFEDLDEVMLRVVHE